MCSGGYCHDNWQIFVIVVFGLRFVCPRLYWFAGRTCLFLINMFVNLTHMASGYYNLYNQLRATMYSRTHILVGDAVRQSSKPDLKMCFFVVAILFKICIITLAISDSSTLMISLKTNTFISTVITRICSGRVKWYEFYCLIWANYFHAHFHR